MAHVVAAVVEHAVRWFAELRQFSAKKVSELVGCVRVGVQQKNVITQTCYSNTESQSVRESRR